MVIRAASSLLLLLAPHIFAAGFVFSGSGQALILRALAITEEGRVQFGSIPAVTGRCVMAQTGQLLGPCAGNDGTPGSYFISGSAGMQVSLAVTPSEIVSGVQFFPALQGPTLVTLDAHGNYAFSVTGALELAPLVGEGQKQLSYMLTVNYQ